LAASACRHAPVHEVKMRRALDQGGTRECSGANRRRS